MHQEVFRTTLAGQERTYERAPTFPDLSEAAGAREDAALSRIAHPRARDRRRRAGGKGEVSRHRGGRAPGRPGKT